MKCLLAYGFSLLPVLAWAQEAPSPPPTKVDLATVLMLAQERSPRLALERQGISIAEAERTTASAYPNPTLNYGRLRPGAGNALFEGKRQQDLELSVPLLLAGQRGARVEAADRNIEAARARFAASGNRLAVEAGVAQVFLLSAQQKRGFLNSAQAELSRLRDIVAGRQASGMASQYDLLRVDIELANWRTRTAEAEAEVVDRQGLLAVLLGFSGWRPEAIGDLRPLPMGSIGDANNMSNPLLDAARKEEAAAQAGTEAARRERFPQVSLSAMRSRTDEPFGESKGVGVSVELPFLDTRRGALDRARAEALAASLRRNLVEAEVQADVERYSIQATNRSIALEQFQQQTGGRLPALRQMTEDAYRLGKSSILELLDATRARYEIQLNQMVLMAGLIEAQLRLQGARGQMIGAIAGH
jgi:outer membrane protein, heavy metal efflux system